jgi:transposase InsO family protein
VSQELHSDQARNFESHIFKLVCKRLGVHKTRTMPYRPQSDGMVKHFNHTLIDAWAKVTEDNDDWDKVAPIVCMYYRAFTHCITGFSPALLMLGRE